MAEFVLATTRQTEGVLNGKTPVADETPMPVTLGGTGNATPLPSLARTATTNSADQTNLSGRGVIVVINVTAAAGGASVVFTIQGKDDASGVYYTILASAAITGISTTVLRVYPGATAVANATANDVLPRTWRINAVHANANSITYSVGASILP